MTRKYYDRDRAHGQGLPANVSDAALVRVARSMTNTPAPTRYDTPTQVMADGYEPIADRPGMYRNAHAVWALRTAEDGVGYVLVRTKEELAPDMRTAAYTWRTRTGIGERAETLDEVAKQAQRYGPWRSVGGDWVSDRHDDALYVYDEQPDGDLVPLSAQDWSALNKLLRPSRHQAKAPPGAKWERLVRELKDDPDVEDPYAVAWAQYKETTGKTAHKVGDRVAMVHRGQLADAMIVLINPAEQLADLVLDGNNEHVRDVPCDHLMAPPTADTMMIELVPTALGGGGEDPFDPDIQPTSKAADSAFGQETDIGNLVEVTTAFQPALYANQITLPEGRLFEVEGQSPGTRDADEMSGLDDLPQPLYPAEPAQHPQYVRIRLRDDETGVVVAVLPHEFEQYLAARGSFPREPSLHRGPSRAPTEDDQSRAPTERTDTVRERPPSES